MLHFDGCVALVTGAGKGLGRAFALALAARGARVLVNNRAHAGETQASADAVVEEIRAHGGEALASHASVEHADAPAQMLDQALAAWGRIDIVIHNAAIAPSAFFTRMDAAEFERVMQVDFMAPVALTRAVLPRMRAQGYGRLLFVTSAAGLYGNRGQAAYSSAKAALIAFMHSIRLEESGYDFRANALAPFAETPMTQPYWPAEGTGRFDPALPAAAAAFLVHEECAANGAVIVAAGGVFRSARSVEGEGVRYARESEITPERIAQDIARIEALTGAQAMDSADACFRRILAENAR